jgi:hypothetical protein
MNKNVRIVGKTQVGSIVQKMNQAVGLPLKEVLPAEYLSEVIERHLPDYRQSGYRPEVMLWAFLGLSQL